MKWFCFLTYVVLIIPARFVLRLTGRDPLMLKDDGRQSYWVELDKQTEPLDYFANAKLRINRHANAGNARKLVPVLRWIAFRLGPRGPSTNKGNYGKRLRTGTRDVPDENYTLW